MTDNHLLRVLVTGASGFLGGNMLRALRKNPQTTPIAACRDPNKISPLVVGRCVNRIGIVQIGALKESVRLSLQARIF